MREKSAGGVFPLSKAQSRRSGLDATAYNPLKLSQLQKPDCRVASAEAQSYRELAAASSLARLPSPSSSLLRSGQTQPSAIACVRATLQQSWLVHLLLPAEFITVELCPVPAVLQNCRAGFCPSGRPNVRDTRVVQKLQPDAASRTPPHCLYPVFS